ncbi:unnamed protein product, partial [Candidula unifasciata]
RLSISLTERLSTLITHRALEHGLSDVVFPAHPGSSRRSGSLVLSLPCLPWWPIFSHYAY